MEVLYRGVEPFDAIPIIIAVVIAIIIGLANLAINVKDAKK